ncbi:MAG: deoxyribodipyrimidine photo-lyase, partial [Pirellula sp.]|nr:deoxyribodipyrimidine photo-lyase [Pirellula sp.]
MEPVHIVWFKRDLRIRDHAALAYAAAQGPVLPLYVFEPDLWRQPEMDATHLQFITQSLLELARELECLGTKLIIRRGDIVSVLESLKWEMDIAAIHSHEEVGGRWTFERDRRVKQWLASHGIPWRETPQCGVVRGLKSRDRWASHWKAWMQKEIPLVPKSLKGTSNVVSESIPSATELHLAPTLGSSCQVGGISHARLLLDSFLEDRSSEYRTKMSSPLSAESHCSRLSPYLAWGCISIRDVFQAVQQRQDALHAAKADGMKVERSRLQSLASFQSRLSWHCHFMQKLDDEPELEFRNMCRVFDGMREDHFRSDYFDAWCRGRTGYPMIDACMRYLHHHRWINFRMRAMLVSFAAYHLWLHWREPALFLARHFLDFEPGIHYPQVQMQSGVTGINTVRIYSPVKQAMDQDPDGTFVRTWLPELEHVP